MNLTKCWLVAFETHCRSKLVEDEIKILHKTDKFLEKCGTKALLKIISFLPRNEIEHVEFKEIKKVILVYVEPQARLIITERTNFLQTH